MHDLLNWHQSLEGPHRGTNNICLFFYLTMFTSECPGWFVLATSLKLRNTVMTFFRKILIIHDANLKKQTSATIDVKIQVVTCENILFFPFVIIQLWHDRKHSAANKYKLDWWHGCNRKYTFYIKWHTSIIQVSAN